jgi:hypothetical protein
MPKKRLPKLKPKRTGAKKMARKKVRLTKRANTPAVVETIIADVIEEPEDAEERPPEPEERRK